MASSVSLKDKWNPALWLVTRAGKMELSCQLETTRCVPQEKSSVTPDKSFIDQACSVKVAWYWSLSFSCEFMGLDSVSAHKLAEKELNQYPPVLTEYTW